MHESKEFADLNLMDVANQKRIHIRAGLVAWG
jgi:hypothetical protein